MRRQTPPLWLIVETMGQSSSHCDRCGHETRRVWGMVHATEWTVAAYYMTWTVGRVAENGAELDLILGRWGDGTSVKDRYLVTLWHREGPEGWSVMVIDAKADRYGNLASTGLARTEVIGTPLAPQVFAIVDAIYEQDGRFF